MLRSSDKASSYRSSCGRSFPIFKQSNATPSQWLFWANTNPKNLYTFSPNFPRFVKIVEISTNPMMHRTKLWKNLLLSPLTGSLKLRIIRLKEIIFLNYLKLVASGFASRVYFHLTKLTNDEGWYLIDLSLIKTNINFTNTE